MRNIVKMFAIIILILVITFLEIYFFSIRGYQEKKKLVEKDELEYGDDYQVFKSEVYTKEPDRIIVKKENTTNEFYIFDKENSEYEHLLKVALDRMFYSSNQDFNLWSFTPYLINDISESNENFIIFDYNGDTSHKEYMYETDFNRDIFFRYSSNTRLYRLIDLLTIKSQTYLIDELRSVIGKEEFVPQNQIMSGYRYMNPSQFMD